MAGSPGGGMRRRVPHVVGDLDGLSGRRSCRRGRAARSETFHATASVRAGRVAAPISVCESAAPTTRVSSVPGCDPAVTHTVVEGTNADRAIASRFRC